MKTFKDLYFKQFSFSKEKPEAERAIMKFNNGYGIMVLKGMYSYPDKEEMYEVAVLEDEELCCDPSITYDTLMPLTEEEVTKIMEKVQKLIKE